MLKNGKITDHLKRRPARDVFDLAKVLKAFIDKREILFVRSEKFQTCVDVTYFSNVFILQLNFLSGVKFGIGKEICSSQSITLHPRIFLTGSCFCTNI